MLCHCRDGGTRRLKKFPNPAASKRWVSGFTCRSAQLKPVLLTAGSTALALSRHSNPCVLEEGGVLLDGAGEFCHWLVVSIDSSCLLC